MTWRRFAFASTASWPLAGTGLLPSLPEIKSAQDAAAVVSAVLTAVASGERTPTDAAEVGKLIDSYVKAYETTTHFERWSQV